MSNSIFVDVAEQEVAVTSGNEAVVESAAVVTSGNEAVVTSAAVVTSGGGVLDCSIAKPVSNDPKDGVHIVKILVNTEVVTMEGKAFHVVDVGTSSRLEFPLPNGECVALRPALIKPVVFVPSPAMKQAIHKYSGEYENTLIVYSYGEFKCAANMSNATRVVEIVSSSRKEKVLIAQFKSKVPAKYTRELVKYFGNGCRMSCLASDLLDGTVGLANATWGTGKVDTISYEREVDLRHALSAVKAQFESEGVVISDATFLREFVAAVAKKASPTDISDSLVHYWS